MNRTMLVGRVVREINICELDSGKKVSNNVIAVNRIYKNDNNQDADFIPFVVWGNRADLLDKYCAKGDLVGLEGKLQSRSYKDKKGELKYVVELNVDNIQFLQPKKDGELDFIKELS